MKGSLKSAEKQNARKNTDFTDVISILDFTRPMIERVLGRAQQLENMPRPQKAKILENKVVASLFFEPSTRTRLSFETAAQNLGARIIGFSDANVTSTSKGETLSDTIHIIENYADIIVMRHFIEGAAKRAAEISKVPIVNAGDGANQHPTQTMLDLYTIRKEFGKIDGIKIALAGDLKYGRTVHSLMYALSQFDNVTVYLISPESLAMPRHIIEETRKKLKIFETANIEKYIKECDVLYATRIQKERFPDEVEYQKVRNAYVITPQIVAKGKPSLRIMHPLPRVNELSQALDGTPAALYFKQAANGIPVREALLSMLADAKKGTGG